MPVTIATLQRALLSQKRLTADQSRQLDAWRGVSALAVFVSHAVQIYLLSTPLLRAIALGSVMVFFVLSGFFIQKSAARSFGSEDLTSFLIRRANRLLPPFAFAMAVVLVLWALAPLFFPSGTRDFVALASGQSFSLEGWPETALLVNGFIGRTVRANLPLWSLSYEVGYYILAWLLMALITGRKVGLLLVPLTLIALARYHDFIMLGSVWAIGFLISVMHSNDRLPKPAAALFVVPIAAVIYFHAHYPESWWFQIAVGVLAATALARSLTTRAWPVKRLNRTAAFSYSLYIIHFPILLFLYGASGERRWMLIPAMLLVLLVAATVGVRLERWHPFTRRRA